MNHLYSPLLVLHVLVAVLGVGSIASIALVAATSRRTSQGAAQAVAWLGPLLRYSVVSLAAMLVTGVLMDLAVNGAFRNSWWFRGSALLLVATGALHGLTRRTVRSGSDSSAVFRRVQRLAYGMCALVAVITVLMELKPF